MPRGACGLQGGARLLLECPWATHAAVLVSGTVTPKRETDNLHLRVHRGHTAGLFPGDGLVAGIRLGPADRELGSPGCWPVVATSSVRRGRELVADNGIPVTRPAGAGFFVPLAPLFGRYAGSSLGGFFCLSARCHPGSLGVFTFRPSVSSKFRVTTGRSFPNRGSVRRTLGVALRGAGAVRGMAARARDTP